MCKLTRCAGPSCDTSSCLITYLRWFKGTLPKDPKANLTDGIQRIFYMSLVEISLFWFSSFMSCMWKVQLKSLGILHHDQKRLFTLNNKLYSQTSQLECLYIHLKLWGAAVLWHLNQTTRRKLHLIQLSKWKKKNKKSHWYSCHRQSWVMYHRKRLTSKANF